MRLFLPSRYGYRIKKEDSRVRGVKVPKLLTVIKGGLMRLKIFILLLILFLFLSFLNCEKSQGIKGRYWYFIDNIEVIEKGSSEILLWAALPINHKGQIVKIGEIYPEPVEIILDSINGNEIVFWRMEELDDKKQLFFYYDFEVYTEEVKTNIEPLKISEYKKESKDYLRYTISEFWIDITPEIKEKAEEIVGDENNAYYKARKIFKWVVENMEYEYPDIKERGAEKSFKKLKGDCGEFSFVFNALCRAVGIPARTVTCMWVTGAGHAWAEFLLPPYGWVPVDPSVAELLTPGSKAIHREEDVLNFMKSRGIPERDPYYLFGNLYPKNRIIVCIGNNIEVVSKKTGIKRTFKFMQPGGNTAFPPGIEFEGISDKTVHTGFYLYGDNRHNMSIAIEKAEKELALSYFNAELFDKAEIGLTKKIKENPEDALSWLFLGQVHMERNELDKAIFAFKKSLAGKAGSIKPVIEVWTHNLLGNCYDLKGMRKEAINEYNNVINSGVNFQGALDSAKKYLKEPYIKSERN